MDSRATIIFLFIIAYLIFANDTATQIRGSDARATLESAVTEARKLLGTVDNATYGDTASIFYPHNSSDGFNHVRDYAWQALPKVQDRVRGQIAHIWGEPSQLVLDGQGQSTLQLYMNVTGEARGEWARSSIAITDDIPRLNMSKYSTLGAYGAVQHSHFERNFTKGSGHVTIGLREKELSKHASDYASLHGNITTIAAEMVLSEDETEQEEEISLRGVYYPRMGHALLTTTSSKFAGLFALPLFSASEYTFNLSRILLNDTISRMIAEDNENNIASINPWGGNLGDNPQHLSLVPKCDMIVYLQQIPPTEPLTYGTLSMLDNELRFPTGAPLGKVPKLHFSMLVFSPDCGYILESKGPPDFSARETDHLLGFKREALQARGRHHMLAYGVVVLLQLISLLRQMREANTPSTRSRVSFYTFACMVFGDACATIIFITISLYVESIWITIMSTAFFSLASMLLFGMRFLSDIWTTHAPERHRQEQEDANRMRQRRQDAFTSARQRQQSAYNATAQQTVNDEAVPPADTSLPTAPPATGPVDFGSMPLFMPADQAGMQQTDEAARVTTFGTIYLRFSFLLVMTLFTSISAITFPDTIRRVYFTTLTMIYLSFWTPQIWRNAWRNCRRALKWEYVAAQSVLRLLPVAYFFGWRGNVLFSEPHFILLGLMCTWVWLQVLVLVSQELVGPRWFVKQAWMPPAWDYHPILQKDTEGLSMPLGLTETEIVSPTSPKARRSSRSSDKKDAVEDNSVTKRVYDCAICMQELEVPVIDSGDNSATSASYLLVRRSYMITPCRHVFHTKCLEGWMKYRMQCPICREELPP